MKTSPIYNLENKTDCADELLLHGLNPFYNPKPAEGAYESILKGQNLLNIFEVFHIGYEFYEPNPNYKHFNDDINDCTARAVSKILNLSWGEAMSLLSNAAIHIGCVPNSYYALNKVMSDFGFNYLYDAYWDDSYEDSQLKVFEFLANPRFRKGKYLICTGNPYPHAICVIDNTIYDNFNNLWLYREILFSSIVRIFAEINNPIIDSIFDE